MLNKLIQSYKAYKIEGNLFGYKNSILDFLNLYFIKRIY